MSASNENMRPTRYYFPELIDNDNLSILAVLAKDILQQNDKIVKVFELNKTFLYGRNPRQAMFLMRQNNKSIFSLTPKKENDQNVEKCQGSSSPVTRNPDKSNMPRRNLSLDEEKEKEHHSEISKLSTPGTSQTVSGSSQNYTTEESSSSDKSSSNDKSSSSDKCSSSDESSSSSTESTSDREADAEESRSSDEKAKETANPTNVDDNTSERSRGFPDSGTPIGNRTVIDSSKDEAILYPSDEIATGVQQITSPSGSTISHEATSEESPRSAEIAKLTAKLTMDDRELEASAKLTENAVGSSQKSTGFSTPIRHRMIIVKSNNKAVLVHSTEEIMTKDEQFTSPVISTISHEATNEESPRSAEIAKMTANLAMVEKQSENPGTFTGDMGESSREFSLSNTPIIHQTAIVRSKVKAVLNPSTDEIVTKDVQFASPVGSTITCEATDEESPRSAEIAKLTANLTMGDTELGSPAKIVGTTSIENQESPITTEIKKVTSSLKVDDKECRIQIEEDEMTGSSATNIISLNPDSVHEDSVTHAERMVINLEPTVIASDIPSPPKISKICSISDSGTQELSRNTEEVKMVGSSIEDVEEIPIHADETNASSNEAIKESPRKRKPLSPRMVDTAPFKSIPRVIHWTGRKESEIEIEVRGSLDNYASPTTSGSLSADYTSYLTIDKSPIMSDSENKIFPKTAEGCSQPSEGPSSIGSDDGFARTDFEIDPDILKYTLKKFKALLEMRDHVLKNCFYSLISFQTNLTILIAYVHNISITVLKIGESAGEYLTKELKDVINDTIAVARKLEKQIKLWEYDADLDANTWRKCYEQIANLKTKYEPIVTNEGEPVIDFENGQVYEYEMKSIWKIMDDMIMMGDSRRALFSNIAYDVEKLMKMFVKCLILVGILYPRQLLHR